MNPSSSLKPSPPHRKTPLHLFITVVSEQLSLVIIHNSVVAPTPCKAVSRRERPMSTTQPGPAASATDRPPQTRHDERNSPDHGHDRRHRDDRVFDPGGVAVQHAPAAVAALAQTNLAELTIPVAPDIPADSTGDADGDDDGKEDTDTRDAVCLVELALFARARVHRGLLVEL